MQNFNLSYMDVIVRSMLPKIENRLSNSFRSLINMSVSWGISFLHALQSMIFYNKKRRNIIFILCSLIFSLLHGYTFPKLCLLIGTQVQLINNQQGNDTGNATHHATPVSNSFLYQGLFISLFHIIICFGELLFSRLPALNIISELENKFIGSILNLSLTQAHNSKTGEITAMLHNNMIAILNASSSLVAMVTAVSASIISYCFAFGLNWKTTLWTIYLIPLLILLQYIVHKYFSKFISQQQHYFNRANGVVQECLSSIFTVLGLNAQNEFMDKYMKEVKPGARAFYCSTLVQAITVATSNLFIYSAYAWVFWIGSQVAGSDTAAQENMYSLALLVVNAAMRFESLNFHINQIQTALVSYRSLMKFTNKSERVANNEPKRISLDTTNCVSFENVSFSYPSRPNDPILKNINLTVNSGECIAIVGKNGSGKSTLVSLLLGLFQPSDGMIKYDTTPLDSINLDHLRKQFGYVSQEPVLFDCTIRENILMGNTEATEIDIHQALVEADADKFVHQLPLKLNTPVGESGAKLSGGQKQRIALARAFVRQPSVFIFDESTSALDSKSEENILKTVAKVCINKTCIIITHRLNLTLRADRVVVLENGSIVEQGKPKQLLKQQHIFYQMFNQQNNLTDALEPKTSAERKDQKRGLESIDSIPPIAEDSNRSTNISMLRDLFGVHGKSISNLIIGLGFSLIDAIGYPITGVLIATALNSFTSSDFNTTDHMSKITMSILMVAVFSALDSIASAHFVAIFASETAVKLRAKLFGSILGNKQMNYFEREKNSSAILSMRLTRDVLNVQKILATQIVNIFSCTISALICWFAAFCVSPGFALCYFLIFPLKQALQFTKTYIKLWNLRRSQPLEEKVAKFVTDMLINCETVKVFSLEEMFYKKYLKMVKLLRRRRVLEAFVDSLIEALESAMDLVCYVFGFGVGSIFISYRLINIYQMWLVHFLNMRGVRKLTYLSQCAAEFSNSYFSISLLLETYHDALKSSTKSGKKPTNKIHHGSVQFRNVTFSYKSRPDVLSLNKINFHIPKNRTLTLVGVSGSGKSTIAALLARLYEPNQGTIKIDDIDVTDLDIDYLRTKVVKVSQEPVLFDCSIEENIKFGMPGVTHQQVETAAKMANAHHFITDLTKGYNTKVGEKGVQLSGGEKQRIAIARALVRKPVILILDEPSSALDCHSEKAIEHILTQQTFTCLLITHRMSTALNADQIIVLSHGQIVKNENIESCKRKMLKKANSSNNHRDGLLRYRKSTNGKKYK